MFPFPIPRTIFLFLTVGQNNFGNKIPFLNIKVIGYNLDPNCPLGPCSLLRDPKRSNT